MIAADVCAIGDRPGQSLQILPVIFDAPSVANHAACVRTVVVGAAVLSDLDLGTVEVAGDAHDHVIERLRPDFPSVIGFRTLLTSCHLHWKQPLLGVGDTLNRTGGRSDGAVVKIDADEIEWRTHPVEVAGLDAHSG